MVTRMLFTWMTEHGRDEGRLSEILHVSAQGVHYAVYVADEAMEELGLDKCKEVAERKISKDPSTRRVLVRAENR
jgi:hypothetical protein